MLGPSLCFSSGCLAFGSWFWRGQALLCLVAGGFLWGFLCALLPLHASYAHLRVVSPIVAPSSCCSYGLPCLLIPILTFPALLAHSLLPTTCVCEPLLLLLRLVAPMGCRSVRSLDFTSNSLHCSPPQISMLISWTSWVLYTSLYGRAAFALIPVDSVLLRLCHPQISMSFPCRSYLARRSSAWH